MRMATKKNFKLATETLIFPQTRQKYLAPGTMQKKIATTDQILDSTQKKMQFPDQILEKIRCCQIKNKTFQNKIFPAGLYAPWQTL